MGEPFAGLFVLRYWLLFQVRTDYGIHTTVRQTMGQDIAGACGQLVRADDGGVAVRMMWLKGTDNVVKGYG